MSRLDCPENCSRPTSGLESSYSILDSPINSSYEIISDSGVSDNDADDFIDASLVSIGENDVCAKLCESGIASNTYNGKATEKLEKTAKLSSDRVLLSGQKIDLDTETGQHVCTRFFRELETLISTLSAETASRQYRSDFSKAYRVLYKENSLCYLTEVLDSAQEAFPYLYVNEEKYVFSQEVLDAGKKLTTKLTRLCRSLPEWLEQIRFNADDQEVWKDVVASLKRFDQSWVRFEQTYVCELMLIEADARRFVRQAINCNHKIAKSESRLTERSELLDRLAEATVKIGQACNIGGLAGLQGVHFQDLDPASPFADAISTYQQLLQRYSENIEIVDPQLRNNADLVSCLTNIEQTWAASFLHLEPQRSS